MKAPALVYRAYCRNSTEPPRAWLLASMAFERRYRAEDALERARAHGIEYWDQWEVREEAPTPGTTVIMGDDYEVTFVSERTTR